MKYKVGDRVTVNETCKMLDEGIIKSGMQGTVVKVQGECTFPYLVTLDETEVNLEETFDTPVLSGIRFYEYELDRI